MPHICADEILMLMAALPFIGSLFARVHAWWHTKFKHKCHQHDCDETHTNHSEK